MRRFRVGFAWVSLAGLLAIVTGCPNPNNYQTPRTTPEGQLQHVVALEGVYLQAGDFTTAAPTLPSYHLRYGLGERVDFGARLINFTSLGIDAKYNFYRSQKVDLAVAPMVQYFNVNGVNGFYFNLPLLAGFNVSDNLTLVATPGFTQAAVVGGEASNAAVSAPIARLGFGVDIRTSSGFSLMPEITAMRLFNDEGGTFVIAGVGFKFGRLPGQEELEEKKRPDAEPAGGGGNIFHGGGGGSGASGGAENSGDIYHHKGGSAPSKVEQAPIGTRRPYYDGADAGAAPASTPDASAEPAPKADPPRKKKRR